MIERHPIRIGPAGWSYTDWEGTVYPPHGSKFDPLTYLAQFFDTIEINSPFYRIPPATHAKSWIRRVTSNRDFKFTTKIFRGFTHEEAQLAAGDVKAFKDYLDPLMNADRLGAILLQFPWSFRNTPESRVKLVDLFNAFAAFLSQYGHLYHGDNMTSPSASTPSARGVTPFSNPSFQFGYPTPQLAVSHDQPNSDLNDSDIKHMRTVINLTKDEEKGRQVPGVGPKRHGQQSKVRVEDNNETKVSKVQRRGRKQDK